jgi:hypothetical protein
MVYVNCEALTLFCCIYLLCVYCCNLISVVLQKNMLHPVKMVNLISNIVKKFHINIPVGLYLIQSSCTKVSSFVLHVYYYVIIAYF